MDHKYKKKYQKLELNPIDSKEKHTAINCPNCAASTPSSNLNIQDKIAKCDSCNSVFSFANEMLDLSLIEQTGSKDNALAIGKLEGVDVFVVDNNMEISLKQPFAFVYLFSFIFFQTIAMPSFGAYMESGIKGAFYAFSIAFTFMLYSLYRMIFRKNDRIYIDINDETLKIEYRPRHFVKDKIYNASDIKQLYIKEKDKRINLYIVINTPNGEKHQKIISRIPNLITAKYLEQEIEKKLGIRDQKIIGEAS